MRAIFPQYGVLVLRYKPAYWWRGALFVVGQNMRKGVIWQRQTSFVSKFSTNIWSGESVGGRAHFALRCMVPPRTACSGQIQHCKKIFKKIISFFEPSGWKASSLVRLSNVLFTNLISWIRYARHYKPRLVYFFTQIPKTIYVLWPLALCMACIQERLLIKSGLW